MALTRLALLLVSLTGLVACGAPAASGTSAPVDAPDAAAPASASAPRSAAANVLTMKINGQEWVADGEVFGAFHPPGQNKVIMIAGTKGPKDKSEQAFNLNIYNAGGPGVYEIVQGNPDNSVVQMGNLSPEHYLYGSMLGFALKVTVTAASSNPTVIEATFAGTMKGNAGDTLTVTDGRFVYRE